MREKRFNKKFSLLFLFAGTLAMIVVMAKTGAPLKTPATPKGIIDLEFAYNKAKAVAIVDSWRGISPADNIYAAKINTSLDFIFLLFYSLLLYHTCNLLATSFTGSLFTAGRLLANVALAAGALDIMENAGMLITLQGYLSDSCTLLTFIFSVTKWVLVTAAVLYILFGGLILLYQKLRTAF